MMRTLRFLLFICALWGNAGLAVNIASMNPNEVLSNSQAWIMVKQRIDSYAQNIQNQVIEKQKVLEEEWTTIKKMRENIENREQLVEKEKVFRQASTDLQQFVQSAKDDMEEAYLNARNLLQSAIFAIVREIAQKNNYDAVVTETAPSFNSPYIYLSPSISINDEVIKILNEELPKIDLKLEWNKDAN